MRKIVDSNKFELLTFMLFLGTFKLLLLCYNILGHYDFNKMMLVKF